MREIAMKTLLVLVLGALLISILFIGGGYYFYQTGTQPEFLIPVLGIAWLMSVWLLFSTVLSKKRKGTISFLRH